LVYSLKIKGDVMGIFWSCVFTVLSTCSYSFAYGFEVNKYTVICASIAGALIGLDFRLREIRNEIQESRTRLN